MSVRVFESRPARPEIGGWVQNTLTPIIDKLKFEGPPVPVEITPLKDFGGLADNRRGDGRIFISNRAQFWSPEGLRSVYVHEVAHRVAAMDHGPIFFVVLAALTIRADANLQSLSLYDFQDQPPELSSMPTACWRASVLGFALARAQTLAESDTPAEKLALQANQYWLEHLAQITSNQAQLNKAELAHQAEISEAKLKHEHSVLMMSPGYRFCRFLVLILEHLGPVRAAAVVWSIGMSSAATYSLVSSLVR